jgi:MoaA/NifB/PqqE/SkfB family radical SAM enzyme
LKVKNLRELGIKEKQITTTKQNKQTHKIDETNKNKQQKIERAIISITTYFILSEIT